MLLWMRFFEELDGVLMDGDPFNIFMCVHI